MDNIPNGTDTTVDWKQQVFKDAMNMDISRTRAVLGLRKELEYIVDPVFTNLCQEIHLKQNINTQGSITGRFKQRENDMITSKELNDKLAPEPKERKVDTSQQVRKLEYDNENAAQEMARAVSALESENYRIDSDRVGVTIPEKYHNRLKGILRDMKKDQEAILDETSATIAKVNKALG